MSTPANIRVVSDEGEMNVIINKHWDGYADGPHGMIQLLQNFVRQVRNHPSGEVRLNDVGLTTSRLIVYIARQYAQNDVPTDFLSLRTYGDDTPYGEYTYELRCVDNDWAQIVGPLRR